MKRWTDYLGHSVVPNETLYRPHCTNCYDTDVVGGVLNEQQQPAEETI